MTQLFDPLRFCDARADGESRQAMIARAAYFLAQRRAFEPGHELEDWLAAEAEVDELLCGDGSPRNGVSP